MPPTRAAGLARLAEFAPRMGRDYAEGRNHDPGPAGPRHVSALAPYIRHRLVTEQEVVAAALAAHGAEAAGKFIQEVFWRSYWKGWLAQRPAVWSAYRARVAAGLAATPEGYAAAIAGLPKPTDGLERARDAGVTLISAHGTADTVVPYAENAAKVAAFWQAGGKQPVLFSKEGGDHHPHGLKDMTPVIEALEKAAR